MTDHEQADSTLADALWWLRGYAAGKGDDTLTADLAEQLRKVRVWLLGLAGGETRLLGTDERRFAVVLTEGEFERMVDGLRCNTVEDRDAGHVVAQQVLARFTAERRAAAERFASEVPF